MDNQSQVNFELGELLSEFIDEYSYLYYLTESKLTDGLTFQTRIRETKICPFVFLTANAPEGYLKPIERVNQIANWFAPDWEVLTSDNFIELLQKVRFFKLHRTILFEGDELLLEFSQEGKTLKTLPMVVSQKKPWHKVSPSQSLVGFIKGAQVKYILNITVKLVKAGSHRQAVNQVLEAVPTYQGNRFFNIFLSLANQQLKLQSPLTEEQVKQLYIKPKGLCSLYSHTLYRDHQENPKFNNLALATKSSDMIELKKEDLNQYYYIKQKISDLNNNLFPFTKKLS